MGIGTNSKKVLVGFTALATLATACGSSGEADAPESALELMAAEATPTADDTNQTPTEAASEEPTDAAPATMTEPGLIDKWEEVADGVVYISVEGAQIVDQGGGNNVFLADASFTGTGFFVSDDGVIVTNNHVVTGASSIQVQVPGDDRPRNARVLGASECWDLAVIELVDSSGPNPYFSWATESPALTTEVFAVGYPLSDPEITVTKGVVSKASATTVTNFASVDDALETDADINPGNSGGPLVTADGTVVGINYAASATARQGFAIKADAAMRIINELQDGSHVDYLGLNAEALATTDPAGLFGSGFQSGLLVRSVETGSDAFNSGLRSGDLIYSVEGTNVATDGTMNEYCDILRTKGPDGDLVVSTINLITGELREDVLVTRQDS